MSPPKTDEYFVSSSLIVLTTHWKELSGELSASLSADNQVQRRCVLIWVYNEDDAAAAFTDAAADAATDAGI